MKFDNLGSNFEPAPEGPNNGVLVSIIDRGEQPGKFGAKRQVTLRWKLVDIMNEKGEPFLIFQTIWNLSLRSEAFHSVVDALLQGENLKGRSLKELVGRAARLTIVHNESGGQTYANIASVKPLKPGVKVPQIPQDQLTYFSLDPDEFNEAVLETLPEKEQLLIKGSATFKDTLVTINAKGKSAAEIIGDSLPENPGGSTFKDGTPAPF